MRVTNMAYSSDDPDVLERRYGGGCMTLFGLPFFLIGLLLLTIGIAYFARDMTGGDEIALFLVGLSFFLAGGALVFWRGGWIINRRQGVLRKWWGFAVFRWTKKHPLDTLEWVRLNRRAVLDSGPKDRYFVHIGGQRLSDPIEMESFRSHRGCGEARHFAEFLAEFLNLPLEEHSNDVITTALT